jgi:hypothetical protein
MAHQASLEGHASLCESHIESRLILKLSLNHALHCRLTLLLLLLLLQLLLL